MKYIFILLFFSLAFSQVTYENITEDVNDAARTSVTLAIPSGWSENDLLLAVIGKDDDIAVTDHADWTELYNATSGTGNALYVAWRLAQIGDTDWTFTSLDTDEDWVGWILLYSGNDETTPIHDSGGATGTTDAPTSPSVSYTDLAVYSLTVRVFSADDNDVPYTTVGITERFNNNNTDTGGAGGEGAAISGTSSTGTFAFGMAASEEWVAVTVIIEGDGSEPAVADDNAILHGFNF